MLRDTLAALEQLPAASRDSERIFLRVLIPAWPNWKSLFVRACARLKPTAWSQAVIPKPVKHPSLAHSGQEHREITIGHTKGQRLVFVSHSARGDRIRIISARLATPRERGQYEEGTGKDGR
jgi:uncharacterized DUF497 family protein